MLRRPATREAHHPRSGGKNEGLLDGQTRGAARLPGEVSRLRSFVAVAAVLLAIAAAQDASPQGLVFDHWLRDTFFPGYHPASSAQGWDVPASANPDHGGIPVSAKTARFGTALDLGDAFRAYAI